MTYIRLTVDSVNLELYRQVAFLPALYFIDEGYAVYVFIHASKQSHVVWKWPLNMFYHVFSLQ